MTEIDRNEQNPILVATDFSEDSKAALIWASHFAESNGAPLVVLHVVHDMAAHPGFYKSSKSVSMEPMLDVAEDMMDDYLAELKAENPGLGPLDTVDVQLVRGLPATRIIEVAGLLNPCLLAIGSRGLNCPSHRKLGSVAERVLELSEIPTLVIKSDKHGVLKKKEIKWLKKKQKKDHKRLKDMLGLTKKSEKTGFNE